MPTDEPLTPHPEAAGTPVFVDVSGRRARRIQRLAAMIVLACLGYGLALLIAALTGVPIEGAVVPYPALGDSHHVDRPADLPAAQPTVGPTIGPPKAVPTASSTPVAKVVSATKQGATPAAKPTAVATTAHHTPHPTTTTTAAHGKSSSAPGATHRPTTAPSAHRRALRP